MISTHDLKRDLFKVFRTGNPDSREVIFLLGSCRIVPYVNYLDIWNRTVGGNRFLIYCHDPVNYNWDKNGLWTDVKRVIDELEQDQNLRSIFASTTIFIHEYFQNYGMFNVGKSEPKNIYQFGLKPTLDVCIPNFHDVFILFNDFCRFSPYDWWVKMKTDLTEEVQREIAEKAGQNLDRFYENCGKTDFPEMAQFFRDNFQKTRLFWTMNHVTKDFSLEIWRLLNEKFLHLPITAEFLAQIAAFDFLSGHYTPLTDYDRQWYGINWSEPCGPLDGELKVK